MIILAGLEAFLGMSWGDLGAELGPIWAVLGRLGGQRRGTTLAKACRALLVLS